MSLALEANNTVSAHEYSADLPMKVNQISVLLLEGKKNIVWSSKTFLEESGYEVHAAASRKEANEQIGCHRFSALITEYIVEGATTLNFVKQFKENNPETYVLLLTNVGLDRKAHKEMLGAGVDDYFTKPLPLEKILICLEKGMREGISYNIT
jgi:two-component system response regulator AtoC